MESPFFSAMLIQPPTIMGRQMQPFSAWHSLFLYHHESPFLTGGEGGGATTEDILFAIWICSTQYPDALSAMNEDAAIESAYEWGEACEEADIETAFEDFNDYITAYMDHPKFWQKDSERKAISGIPWPFKIVSTILANYPAFSETEIWNMPLNRLAAYRASIAEDNGAEVVSIETEKLIAKAREN